MFRVLFFSTNLNYGARFREGLGGILDRKRRRKGGRGRKRREHDQNRNLDRRRLSGTGLGFNSEFNEGRLEVR